VVLVIDEINRADLSRVFGELITLLEVDKRVGGREETAVTLPYSHEVFTVPMELSIVGTMNTADKSLAIVDLALRRRFVFKEIDPNPALCTQYGGVDIAALLAEWNKRISLLRNRDYRIGHSELMNDALELVRIREQWAENDIGRLQALAFTIRFKVVPTLLDYFPDDWRKVGLVVGEHLFEVVTAGSFAALAEDRIGLELTGESTFALAEWWNPMNDATWDGPRFAATLTTAQIEQEQV
jgi:5-methylcytosine-specific restriction protein B